VAAPDQGESRTWRFKLDDTRVLEVSAPMPAPKPPSGPRPKQASTSRVGLLGTLVVTLTLLAVVFTSGASAEGTPAIASDKSDYLPGEAVALSGTGWTPGETVHVAVDDDQSDAWTYEADLTAADDGTVSDALTLPDVAGAYSVTATAPSGTATTAFTATAPAPPPPPPPPPTPPDEASIASDKSEYASGDTVALTGSGWASTEAVHIVVDDDQNDAWTHEADVTAATDGTVSDSFDLPELTATFTVSATAPSGTASASFTVSAQPPVPPPAPTADPTLSSDKDAYSPGATVALSGNGWTAGGSVHVAVDDDKGDAWEHTTNVTVAADGSIADSVDLPSGLAATFTATATESASRSAETTFTASFASASVPYLVRFASGTSTDTQAQILASAGAESQSYIGALRIHGVLLPGGDSLQASLDKLRSYNAVISLEPDREREAGGTPNDSNYGDQWSLPQIGWENVFGTVSPGGSARVAILDTGIDGSHPDLDGNVVSGTSILDGSNGLTDPNGHGTAMAGIVAAETDNGQGVAGVAYAGVTVLPVTVLGSDGTGQDSDIIEGVVYAAEHNASVILMAFSNPGYSEMLQAAIDYAWENGAVLVAATGNDGSSSVTFPAGDRGVIGVSNTDQSDALNSSSNYGQAVFLGAPGTGIATTSAGGGYTSITGTSAAAAEVAGAAALIKASSGASNGVVVSRLAKNAEPAGTVEQTGNGRLNVDRALADESTDTTQPSGADPVGSGGPFLGPYVADALQLKLYSDTARTIERVVFERGDAVYAKATGLSTSTSPPAQVKSYKFEAFDKSGTSKGLGSCITGSSSGGTANDMYAIQVSDPVSDATEWRYVLHEYAGSTCGGAASDTTAFFDVADVESFADSARTTPKTVFAPGDTVYLRVLGYVDSANNISTTWIKPSTAVACSNTSGGDRADASTSGTVLLEYPESSADGSGCAAIAAADAGLWQLRLESNQAAETVDLDAFTVVSDTTAPTVTVDSLQGSAGTDSSSPFAALTNAGATINWHANENGSFEVRRGGTNCTSGTVVASGTYSTQPASVATAVSAGNLSEGANTLRVCVIDTATNTGASADSTLTKDTTKPTISITHTANANGWNNTDPVSESITASDSGGSGVDSVDCTDSASGLGAVTGSEPNYSADVSDEGIHNLSCTATDAAGNTSDADTDTVKIDLTDPTTSIPVKPPSVTNSTSAHFEFNGTDPVSGGTTSGVHHLECQLDGGGFTTCTSPQDFAGLTIGVDHTFDVRAIDYADNTGTATSYTWHVNAAPDVLISAGASQSVQYSDALGTAVTISASDVDSNGSALTATATGLPTGLSLAIVTGSTSTDGTYPGTRSWTVTGTVTASAGSYPVTVRVKDDYNATGNVSFTITVTKEDASIEYSGDGIGLANANLTLQATVRDSGAASYTGTGDEPDTSHVGDISKMWVAFDIYSGSSCAGSPATTKYAQVVDSGTAGDGLGTATTTYIGSEGAYCVAMRIVAGSSGSANLYYAAPVSPMTGAFALYENIGQFVTGGGWIPDGSSGNEKGNFGFNARFNKNSKPQGQMVYVYRGTYNGNPADYIFKSNSLDTLGFSKLSPPYPISATLQGNCNLQVVQDSVQIPGAGQGNLRFVATVTDGGLPSSNNGDYFSLTVTNSTGGTVIKSLGATQLGGGNVVVHPK
jgi:subtilisin family serine protease